MTIPDVESWSFATPRLLIRAARVEDAEAMHWIRGQMPYDPQHRDIPETRAMIADMAALAPGAPGWRRFALLPAGGGALVGDVGVRFDHPGPWQAEIGFALHPEARGRGFATEAVGAIVERLFENGVHRVQALTDARNVATQRLLTRLRFRHEAHYVQSWHDRGAWLDEFGYARLASD